MDAFQTLSTQELYVLQNTVQQELHSRDRCVILSAIAAHEEYVGSCYKKYFHTLDTYYYLKVFSSYASSEYYVAAVKFPERASINFTTNWHKVYFSGDGVCGRWEGKLVEIGEVLIKELNEEWIKIEEEEYNKAFENFVNSLKNYQFIRKV